MRVALPPGKAFVFALVFITGAAAGQLAPPVWKSVLAAAAEGRYQEATYRCDRAMRSHMIAKQRVFRAPGEDTVAELEAAEVALLDCQDYDLLRKRLIRWGLNENDLSLMALKAIEAKDQGLQRVIEIHEIRH